MFDTQAWIEKLVADPTVQKPEILYIRKLRSLAAEGTTGDGAVVATVNGYGALTEIRIAPEVMADLPRLERLVMEAVNLATDEAERLRPPPPLFPPLIGGDPTEWPIDPPQRPVAADPQPVVRNMQLGRFGYLPTEEEPGRTAFLEAAAPIRMQIYRDMLHQPEELHSLFWVTARELGNRRLTAAYARRMMQYKDPNVLRRFSREVRLSLTDYIRKRQQQLAAKMYHRSGLLPADVARLLGYPSEKALVAAVEDSDLDAFCDNGQEIRMWIYFDSIRKPPELESLLSHVGWNLHRSSLTAASARQSARKPTGLDSQDILRRFRRATGISLSEYIRRRQSELAARMAYTSDMPVDKIADFLGYASGKALTRAVEAWARCSLEELRDRWEDRGIDSVVWERVERGEASQDDWKQYQYEVARLNAPLVEELSSRRPRPATRR